MSNDINIVSLPKDKWKGTPIPLVWFLFSQGSQKKMIRGVS